MRLQPWQLLRRVCGLELRWFFEDPWQRVNAKDRLPHPAVSEFILPLEDIVDAVELMHQVGILDKPLVMAEK